MKGVEYKCKVSIYREIAIQKPHGKHKTKIPTKKKKKSKHNTKDSHQITREGNKRRKGKKDLQKQIQNINQMTIGTYILIIILNIMD